MLTSTTQLTRFGVLGARGLQFQSALTKGASIASLVQRQFAVKASKSICTASTNKRAVKKPATTLQCQFAARRYASTTTGSTAATPLPGLDWNTFFTLRKTRRRYQLACSVVTMLIGGSVAGLVLINIDLDALGKLPLDPFITLGLITMGSAALGWLAGPSLGSTIFYIVKRGVKTPMATKEIEFFARVKKNRVDPSVSSVGNPGKPIIIDWHIRVSTNYVSSAGLLWREDL